MVGVVFKKAFPAQTLEDLRRISEIGKVPDQGDEVDGHRDGWGMISFGNGSPFYLGRSPRPPMWILRLTLPSPGLPS